MSRGRRTREWSYKVSKGRLLELSHLTGLNEEVAREESEGAVHDHHHACYAILGLNLHQVKSIESTWGRVKYPIPKSAARRIMIAERFDSLNFLIVAPFL